MIEISNEKMLSAYAESDELKYLYDIINICKANPENNITEIKYYVKDINDPLADYAYIKKYWDGSVIIGIYTLDEQMIEQISEIALGIDSENIELITPHPELFDNPSFSNKLEITECEDHFSPIFVLKDKECLPALSIPDNTEIFEWNGENKEAAAKSLSELGDCVSYLNELFKDTKRYLMKSDGKIVGYLRAECAYKNYYEIGWLYIEPAYRSRGFGADIVLYYALDCLKNGKIPSYGYAINNESVRVAEKCGFVNIREKVFAKKIKKREKHQ